MPKTPPPEARAYLSALPATRKRTITALRSILLRTEPTLVESINPWGYLAFSTARAEDALTIVTHERHANLQLYNGSRVAKAFPTLKGTGKNLRHIKVPYDEPVDQTLIAQAVRLCLAA